jgi:5-methylcytosine-specific restriction protein A
MINEQFQQFFNGYGEIARQPYKASDTTKIITADIPESIREKLYLDDNYYIVYGSCGSGQWAEVIWVAILDKRISKSTQHGYYIVYLLSPAKAELYLSLAIGWTQFSEEFGNKLGKEKILSASLQLSNNLRNIPPDFKSGPIDLGAKGLLAKGYENGQIISKGYKLSSLPDEKAMLNDIRSLLGTYEELINIAGPNVIDILSIAPKPEENASIERTVANASLKSDTARALKDLINIAEAQPPEIRRAFVKKIVRNSKFASFVKERSKYICEVCGKKPFIQKNGKPYAEADHIIALGNKGLDHPDNMRCLCAQCHAIITHGSEEEIKKLPGGVRT